MSVERRTRKRFPLQLPIRFAAGKGRRARLQGQGEVVNISSRGVAFRTDADLIPGWAIDASMNWPVMLNETCMLRITIQGRILRASEGLAVMSVERYEFRTGRATLAGAGVSAVEALKRTLSGIPAGPEARVTA